MSYSTRKVVTLFVFLMCSLLPLVQWSNNVSFLMWWLRNDVSTIAFLEDLSFGHPTTTNNNNNMVVTTTAPMLSLSSSSLSSSNHNNNNGTTTTTNAVKNDDDNDSVWAYDSPSSSFVCDHVIATTQQTEDCDNNNSNNNTTTRRQGGSHNNNNNSSKNRMVVVGSSTGRGEEGSSRNAAAQFSSSPDVVVPATWSNSTYMDYWLVISQRLNLAVTMIPKVMCTSIRTAFNGIECTRGVRNKRCAEVRWNHALRQKRFPTILAGANNNNSMTHIAFVRDPFERALSAYKNSNSNRYIHLRHCHNKTMCSFAEWVHELGRNPTAFFRNEHFRPQVTILQFDRMRYDHIFRMSSPIDQRYFWKTLCHKNHSIRANAAAATHHDKENDDEMTILHNGLEHFSPSVFDILSKLYAKDLVLWETVLQYGTPRQPDERTLYDYYMSCKTRAK